MKRRRPKAHYRTVKTNKGSRRVLVNKGIKKKVKRKMAWSGRTETPLMDHPESFGYKKEIKQMTPGEFLEQTRMEAALKHIGAGEKVPSWMDDHDSYVDVIISKERAKKLQKPIKSKKKIMSEAWLELDDDGHVKGHEGRHRAFAAKQLGEKTIPVHVVRKNYGSSVLGRVADKKLLHKTYSPDYEHDTLVLPYGHSKSINLNIKSLKKLSDYARKENVSQQHSLLQKDRAELDKEIQHRKSIKKDLTLLQTKTPIQLAQEEHMRESK